MLHSSNTMPAKDGKNWLLWAPDTSFTEVEKVNESQESPSSVLHVHYKMPVVNDRDVVIFETTHKGLPDDPGAADSWTSFAMSIQHPHCPKRRGVVRGAPAGLSRHHILTGALGSQLDDHRHVVLTQRRWRRARAVVSACRSTRQCSGWCR